MQMSSRNVERYFATIRAVFPDAFNKDSDDSGNGDRAGLSGVGQDPHGVEERGDKVPHVPILLIARI